MKTLRLIVAFLMIIGTAAAQTKFPLPSPIIYGKPINTKVYEHFGPMSSTGKGSIHFGGSLAMKFITGLKFYMLVDSIEQGSAPTHSAFKDSSGVIVPMYKNDKLLIPASFMVYSGKIGFRIVVEGTATVSGEAYPCDIGPLFTTGENWEMYIAEVSQKKCNVVTVIDGIENNEINKSNVIIYPNPTSSQLMVDGYFDKQGTLFRIFDKLGKEVQNGLLTSRSAVINVERLVPGDYLIQIGTESKQTFKIIKQ